MRNFNGELDLAVRRRSRPVTLALVTLGIVGLIAGCSNLLLDDGIRSPSLLVGGGIAFRAVRFQLESRGDSSGRAACT